MGRVALVARVAVPVAVLVLAALATGAPGFRGAPPVRAADGGCSPSSATCLLFNATLQHGPGVGTGFGTYRTKNPIDATWTRIVCKYGNEVQSGTCGWGYEVGVGEGYTVIYSVLPDPGSQACQVGGQCYPNGFEGKIVIFGNYLDSSWSFELISHVQVDAVIKGTGSGTVTSQPAGIDCPDDCDDLYPSGFPVKLTAKPDAGSVFAGWSDDCASSGTDSVCTLVPEFLLTATATFNKKATPRPPTQPPVVQTEPPPTEEVTPEPPTEAPTGTPAAAETVAATATQDSTVGSGAEPSPTADPSASSAAGGGGNLPIVILLGVLLVVLVAGAVFAFRRGGGSTGA